MARVQKVEFEVLQVSLIRVGTLCRKDGVVLPPDDQRRRLLRTEVFLPLRITPRLAAGARSDRAGSAYGGKRPDSW